MKQKDSWKGSDKYNRKDESMGYPVLRSRSGNFVQDIYLPGASYECKPITRVRETEAPESKCLPPPPCCALAESH